MIEYAHQILFFMAISSLQMLILGAIALGAIRWLKINGSTSLWVLRLVLLLPLLSPIGWLIPSTALDNLKLPDHALTSIPLTQAMDYQEVNTSPVSSVATQSPPDLIIKTPKSTASAKTQSPDLMAQLEQKSLPGNPVPIQPPLAQISLPSQQNININWPLCCLSIWLIGLAFLAARLIHGRIIQLRLVRSSELVCDQQVLGLLEECAALIGLSGVPCLAVTREMGIPLLVGSVRPRILIPPHLLEEQNRQGLCFTLLHELAHIKRRDHWWMLLEKSVAAVYFFHPMIHLVQRKIEEQRESLCDREVVLKSRQKASYADFLLCEVWNAGRKNDLAYAIPMLGKRSVVSHRVHNILNQGKSTMLTKLRNALALIMITALMLPVLALNSSSSDKQASSNKNIEQMKLPDRTLKLTFNGLATGDETTYLYLSDSVAYENDEESYRKLLQPTVKGRTFDADTTNYIEEVNINLLRPADSWDPPSNFFMPTRSADFGWYTLKPTQIGQHKMVATKQGYAPHYFTLDIPSPIIDKDNSLVFPGLDEQAQLFLKKADTSIRARLTFNGKAYNSDTVRFGFFRDGNYYDIPYQKLENEDGLYIITGVTPGDARISSRDYTDIGSIRRSPKEVSIKPGHQNEMSFDLTLRVGYEINFIPKRFADFEEFEIEAPGIPESDTGSLCFRRWSKDRFSMELPKEHYKIRLKAPGYKVIEFDPLDETQEIKLNNQLLMGQFSLVLEKETANESSSINGHIVGKLYDGDFMNRGSHFERALPITGLKQTYHIRSRFKEIRYVSVLNRYEDNNQSQNSVSDRWQSLTKDDWVYEPETHRITIKKPIETDVKIYIQGKIEKPWVWKTIAPIIPGSLQMLTTAPISLEEARKMFNKVEIDQSKNNWMKGLNKESIPSKTEIDSPTKWLVVTDRLGIQGRDYEFDEEEGLIKFIDESNCYEGFRYHISYKYLKDPKKPEEITEDSFGYYPNLNQAKAKIFGITQTNVRQPKEIIYPKVIQINAEPTHDPNVYALSYVIKKEEMRVCVFTRNYYEEKKVLNYGIDYKYDADKSLIILLKDDLIDRNKEQLVINAEPTYNAFVFHRLQSGDPLSIKVEGQTLTLGEDYQVDYSTGRITIKPSDLIKPGVRFRIDAGSTTLMSQKIY